MSAEGYESEVDEKYVGYPSLDELKTVYRFIRYVEEDCARRLLAAGKIRASQTEKCEGCQAGGES